MGPTPSVLTGGRARPRRLLSALQAEPVLGIERTDRQEGQVQDGSAAVVRVAVRPTESTVCEDHLK